MVYSRVGAEQHSARHKGGPPRSINCLKLATTNAPSVSRGASRGPSQPSPRGHQHDRAYVLFVFVCAREAAFGSGLLGSADARYALIYPLIGWSLALFVDWFH